MDNLDLAIRRKRQGMTQREVVRAMPHPFAVSALSDFENGERDSLPHGQGRKEYEAILASAERASKRGGSK